MTPRARLTALIASGSALGMLALAFAAEPLYSTFCKVTGFGGTTRVAEAAPAKATRHPIRIRFDANVDKDLGLTFRPTEAFVDARVGQTVMTFYEVANTSDAPVRAMAAFNVAPHKAGKYFNKVECFCFKERTYQPGRSERLPVVFFVDPDMLEDRYSRDVRTITLSYTYYRAGDPTISARLENSPSAY